MKIFEARDFVQKVSRYLALIFVTVLTLTSFLIDVDKENYLDALVARMKTNFSE